MQSKKLLKSSHLMIAIKATLTLLAFWFVFRGVDFAHLGDIFYKQDHSLILQASLLLVFQCLLGGIRWRLIVNTLGAAKRHLLSVFQSQRIYYIGGFFTTCLPGTVGGDMIRVWLARDTGIPLSLAINSVIIDRMVALFAVGILVLCNMPMIAGLLGLNIALVYGIAVVALQIAVFVIYYSDRLLKRYAYIKPVHWLLHFMLSLKMILSRPVLFLVSLILAIIAHVSYTLSACVLAQSLGIPISMMQCLSFIPLIMLVTSIPISIGGWGLREASMVGLLGLIGVKSEAALMLSIQMGLLIMLVTLPASVMWLFHKKPRDVL